MSAFDKAIKLQKSIDNNLEYKESTEKLLVKQTIQLDDYIEKCSNKIKVDLDALNKLGYEYIEHNNRSSIRKKR